MFSATKQPRPSAASAATGPRANAAVHEAGADKTLLLRCAALALMCVSIAATHALPKGDGLSILVITFVYAAFLTFVRGLGSRLGMLLGLLVGLVVAVELGWGSRASLSNQLAFGLIAASITALLGNLAGAKPSPEASESQARRQRADERSTAHGLDLVLGGIAADYCEWALAAENDSWASFDLFIRSTLRERLGAARVRCFHVKADEGRLEPLTHPVGPAGGENARDASLLQEELFKWVAASQCPYIASASTTHVSDSPAESPSALQQHWTWALPVWNGSAVTGLVAIGHFENSPRRAFEDGREAVDMAHSVASMLNVFWSHVRQRRDLFHGRCLDWQSGVMNRTQLLVRTEEAARESVRDHEPLMALAIGIEGLRGLDDAGHWAVRDKLIQEIGKLLRARVRSDDLVGRFTDERFIVVLRRVDLHLGMLVAQNLVQAVRDGLQRAGDAPAGFGEATDATRGPSTAEVIVRAGLAGRSEDCADGKMLLERALVLLDAARREDRQIAIAADAMHRNGPAANPDDVCSAARMVALIGSAGPGDRS